MATAAAANAAEVQSDKPQAGAASLDNDAAAAIAALEVKDQKEHKEQKEHKQGDDAAAGSDSEEDGDEKAADGAAAAEKKKKKKKKKKKAGASAAVGGNACGVHLFCQGGRNPTPAAAGSVPIYNANKAVRHRVQTSPVSVPIADLYKDKIFPEGQILNHPGDFNTFRTGSEEKRAAERLYEGVLAEAREAAEVHRQVRADFQRWVRPGLSMIEIAQYIENGTRAGLKSEGAGLKRGWGFPTGLSLNHVAAHYSPNYKDTTVLKETDVMKVDFGTHINGTIIDCAFTVAFDPKFDPLLEAVREATNAGLNAAGIDVRLCDIGGAIQEVMESYEVEIGGVTHKVKPIQGLCGHSIGPYKIHYGKSVPALRNHDVTKMEEGEFYAIETFGSTGRARVLEDGECSHFMKTWDQPTRPLRTKAAKDLLRHIDTHHGTLAFARRWLDDAGQTGHMGALKELCDAGVVNKHPPLVDIKGSYTAQFEHTFFLRPTCKEILTRGDDY